MSHVLIQQLRTLRRDADVLRESIVDDLKPFLNADQLTFRRLPDSPSNLGDVNVTTTCSCVMALALTDKFERFYESNKTGISPDIKARDIVEALGRASWVSSGLEENNAFTSSLIVRTFGFLREFESPRLAEPLKSWSFPHKKKKPDQSISSIALSMASRIESFGINKYPPAAPVVYWLVDGVSRAKIAFRKTHWQNLLDFAGNYFNHERSLVSTKHDALMDPVAMGMAACLCARLRAACGAPQSGIAAHDLATLPSLQELLQSVKEMFNDQLPSGIWPKYFPMFHYQDAGSNFCFTFELLEAVLREFGAILNGILTDPHVIEGLERAVSWCKSSRLPFFHDGTMYSGWNAGGNRVTLQEGKPESWATAVVHMFLWELSDVISAEIQRLVLDEYNADCRSTEADTGNFDQLVDIQLSIEGEETSLKELIRSEIISPNSPSGEAAVRRTGIKNVVSALLFGPPGTSKTYLTKTIAEALGWPRIVISPSDFVRESLEKVYLRVDEIFRDLGDLAGVVVFFDEMDALMQSRQDAKLDTETQFLTTSMLPQLTKLHDKGRVVFLMATNYQSRFDRALKRSGRFDLLLCVGPPTFDEKLTRLNVFLGEEKMNAELTKAAATLRAYAPQKRWLFNQLELFTFAEFADCLEKIGNSADIGTKLERLGQAQFEKQIRKFSKYVTLGLDEGAGNGADFNLYHDAADYGLKTEPEPKSEFANYQRDRKQSKRQ